MDVIATLILGLAVGAIAKLVMPGKDPSGVILTMLLGVAGAFVAAMIGTAFGWYRYGEGPGFIASIIGALIVLAIYRLALGRRIP